MILDMQRKEKAVLFECGRDGPLVEDVKEKSEQLQGLMMSRTVTFWCDKGDN